MLPADAIKTVKTVKYILTISLAEPTWKTEKNVENSSDFYLFIIVYY